MRKKALIFLLFILALLLNVSYSKATVNCAKDQICSENKVGTCQYCSKTNLDSKGAYVKGGAIAGAKCTNENGCWVDAACWTNSGKSDFTGATGSPAAKVVECCNSGDCLTSKGAGWACKNNTCTQEINGTDKALEDLGGVSPTKTEGCVGDWPANAKDCSPYYEGGSFSGTRLRTLSPTDTCIPSDVPCLFRCDTPFYRYSNGKCLLKPPSVQLRECDSDNNIRVSICCDPNNNKRYKLIPEIDGAVREDKAMIVSSGYSNFQGELGKTYNFRAYEIDGSGNQIGISATGCVNGTTKCGFTSEDTGGLDAPNPDYPNKNSIVSCSAYNVNLNSGQAYENNVTAVNADKITWSCTGFDCQNYICNPSSSSFPMTSPRDLVNGSISGGKSAIYNNTTNSMQSRVCTFTVWNSKNEGVKATCVGTVNVSPEVVSTQGVCGEANRKIYEKEATVSDSLCASGASNIASPANLKFIAMDGAGAGYFSVANWTCGAYVGMINCSAYKKTNSSCGTANGREYKIDNIGNDTYCAEGYEIVGDPEFPSTSGIINWRCKVKKSWLGSIVDTITLGLFNREVPANCSANKIDENATDFDCGTAVAATYSPQEDRLIVNTTDKTLCSGDSHANYEAGELLFGTDNKTEWTCINNTDKTKTKACVAIRVTSDGENGGKVPSNSLNLCGLAGTKDPSNPRYYSWDITTPKFSDNLCLYGNPYPIDVHFPEMGKSAEWTCKDELGYNSQKCYAFRNSNKQQDDSGTSETIITTNDSDPADNASATISSKDTSSGMIDNALIQSLSNKSFCGSYAKEWEVNEQWPSKNDQINVLGGLCKVSTRNDNPEDNIVYIPYAYPPTGPTSTTPAKWSCWPSGSGDTSTIVPCVATRKGDASTDAVIAKVSGKCGIAAGNYYSVNETDFRKKNGQYDFCEAGDFELYNMTTTHQKPVFPSKINEQEKWTCVGKNGGGNEFCTAKMLDHIKGECGTASGYYDPKIYSDWIPGLTFCNSGTPEFYNEEPTVEITDYHDPSQFPFPVLNVRGRTKWTCLGSETKYNSGLCQAYVIHHDESSWSKAGDVGIQVVAAVAAAVISYYAPALAPAAYQAYVSTAITAVNAARTANGVVNSIQSGNIDLNTGAAIINEGLK